MDVKLEHVFRQNVSSRENRHYGCWRTALAWLSSKHNWGSFAIIREHRRYLDPIRNGWAQRKATCKSKLGIEDRNRSQQRGKTFARLRLHPNGQ